MTRRDALSRLVADRNRRFNTPKQMEVTERPVSKRTICLDCRAPFDRDNPPPNATGLNCPECGDGKLIEVEW